MMQHRPLRENDVVRWKWKDKDRQNIAPFGDYHCYSRTAIYTKGYLRDTYWGSMSSDKSRLNLDIIDCEIIANIDEMEILRDNQEYYRSEDVLDLNHSNWSRAPIYKRKGANRCRIKLLIVAEDALNEALQRKKYAEWDIETRRKRLAEIREGKIEGVYP